ncbi:MAG: DNA polymerase III subunit alpha [Clostridiales bacterium]|jgi:DNA polymerase-3 subunit alpha|nr:DNA polymerase III subunit alpha [Clostridiales bacterium]
MSFIHLRVHSEYSFLRGACRLEALVDHALELGMPAVALTDYNVLHGAARFTEIARRKGIVPILGVEFRLPSGLPLVLLVRDTSGWENLLLLTNHVQLSRHPTVLDLPALGLYHKGLSAVLHAQGDDVTLSADVTPRAVAAELQALYPVFGSELFMGLEDAGVNGTVQFNRLLAELALAKGVPLLATHNVHYVLPGDDTAYRMVNCVRDGRPLAGTYRSFCTGYDLKSPAEMQDRFASYPGAYENTLRLARRCSFILEAGPVHLPVFTPPGGESDKSCLRRLCCEGLRHKGIKTTAARRRLAYEMSVIHKKGLASYFLIVHDLVGFAERSAIPVGPGRGSAGGSLVAYLLGITRVDPLAHGLYFERFLSEDRTGFPDIDLDVCQRRRDELLTYLRSRYGKERVAQVSTFSTLGARAAVREVGKVLDATGDKIAAVAEALPYYSGQGGIEAAVRQYPEFRSSLLRGDSSRTLLNGASQLEGLCRHLSTHASGVILGVDDLTRLVPLCRGASGEVLTQWDKDDVEAHGFLKIDILGSRNLTVIQDTLTFVTERRGSAPTTEEIPLNDKETFAALRRGEGLGCFQLESTGMRRILRRLAPERLDDLIHLLSLYRPGPWESGMVETFIARRHGVEKVSQIHPALAPILDDTYGVVLYQEQVMRIANEIGGYTPGEADRLRREMTRRSPLLQTQYRETFIAGAAQKGIGCKEATDIFDHLCRFAGYGFNKAHSAAYALVSYWTAYLKYHYPVEFYAALLSSGAGYYGPAVYVQEARSRGITVLPPHINGSGLMFTPEENAIRAALPLVRDLGSRGAAAILTARQSGPFHSLADFCRRVGRGLLRRSALSNMAKAGAFDGLGLNRRQTLASLDDVLKHADKVAGQLSIFDLLPQEEETPQADAPAYTVEEIVGAELENLGMALTAHPLTVFTSKLTGISRTPLSKLATLPPERDVTVAGVVVGRSRRRLKRGGVMLTLYLSDESGFAEAVFFPEAYKRCFYRLDARGILVTGKTTADGDCIIAEHITPLAPLP